MCVWTVYRGNKVYPHEVYKQQVKVQGNTYFNGHWYKYCDKEYAHALLLLFSCYVVPDSLWPHELQHTRLPCSSLSPRVCSNSCPMSQWCHPITSSSVTLFSSCPQSFSTSGSFPMSWLFASGGQTGASASAPVLPTNIQGWLSLGLTGWISLLSKGLSRVFPSTTVWKHQFFSSQLSLWSNSHNTCLVIDRKCFTEESSVSEGTGYLSTH